MTVKCIVARTVVVSKALRKVDQETRREVRDKRLRTLEADNYAVDLTAEAEEEYSDEVSHSHLVSPFLIHSRRKLQVGRRNLNQRLTDQGQNTCNFSELMRLGVNEK
jgi:ribosomal protein S25